MFPVFHRFHFCHYFNCIIHFYKVHCKVLLLGSCARFTGNEATKLAASKHKTENLEWKIFSSTSVPPQSICWI